VEGKKKKEEDEGFSVVVVVVIVVVIMIIIIVVDVDAGVACMYGCMEVWMDDGKGGKRTNVEIGDARKGCGR
jgi:hypothetical protein